MPRLRRRLDALQSHAHHTMGLAEALLADLHDGVRLRLVRVGDATLLDFLAGKVDSLPLEIRIDPEEPDK